jgi:DNA-3-methyladenine glycosylase I
VSGSGLVRCEWPGDDPLYVAYHDTEWGVPVHDDRVHFEFLVLESAQAGLSWITILRKRSAYRSAYDGFDPAIVADYDEAKIQSLLGDAGIVRNRRKIRASVNNAKHFLEVQREYGSFDSYIWNWVEGTSLAAGWREMKDMPATTPLSDRVSADMKKRGFTFIGSTIIYSYLQAVGVVNDHIGACFCFDNHKM